RASWSLSLRTVPRFQLGRPIFRPAVAAAAARLDDDEVVGGQAHGLLAADHTLARSGIQGDPERRRVAPAGEPVGRDHAPVEHARQGELRGQDAIGPPESEAAAMGAVAAGAEAERLLLDHDRVLALDD